MKSFKTGSYQLAANKKWVPAGSLFEPVSGGASLNIQGFSFPDKHFETEAEADKFFTDYCLSQGYVPVQK